MRKEEAGAAALAELYGAHRERLLRQCRRALKDPVDAEDAVQETFTRLAQRNSGLLAIDDMPAYLSRTARNVCLDHLRRRRPAEGLVGDGAGGADIEDRALQAHEISRIWARLTRRERALLAGSAAGWSSADMARHHGDSTIAVARALARARARARGLAGRIETAPALIANSTTTVAARLSQWGSEARRRVLDMQAPRLFEPHATAVIGLAAALCVGTASAPGVDDSRPHPMAGARRVVSPTTVRAAEVAALTGQHPAAIAVAPPSLGANAVPVKGNARPVPPGGAPVPPIDQAQISWLAAGPTGGGRQSVFAAGTMYGCASGPLTACPVIFRSDDAGTTWTRLAAAGYRGGPVLPAAGDMLFAATTRGLQRSDDGGATFRTVVTVGGPIAIDPGSPAGDPRVLVASPSPVLYDSATGRTSAGPLLPPGTTAPQAVAYAGAGHPVMVVTAASGDSVLVTCDRASACRTVLDVGASGYGIAATPMGTVVAWANDTVYGGVFAGASSGPTVYTSSDAGHTYTAPAAAPAWAFLGTVGTVRGVTEMLIAAWSPPSANFAPYLAVSNDGGRSFVEPGSPSRLLQPGVLLVLGSGRIIAAAGPSSAGVHFSDDGGRMWSAAS